ncbi:chaperone protein dnaJ 72 [Dorcoceras hygrometricum]|uniref:Chaperone protein dnaJ 72 n=1 Tax=Dorcoceras hygrometricum TaxID=472368 RepID=A0A2Z7CPS7_9LAMI|nr:chaperone protein dnaJ 72 [Dorcoceras hygrometricum]
MDHYHVLGVRRNASKEEIKQAFRKLAIQFHPDKHSQSSKHLKDSATFKFRQLSEAYETLIDDRKRADYNISRNAYGAAQNKRYDYAYDRGRGRNSYGYGYGYSGSASRGAGVSNFARFEMGLRYLTTRSFLLNATFAGVLLGGMYIIDAGGKALWKKHNPGVSYFMFLFRLNSVNNLSRLHLFFTHDEFYNDIETEKIREYKKWLF